MKKILLVEDDMMHCALVQDILEMADYHVQYTNDGREALLILESESFDLILTDINMPKMDGIELLGEIRKKKKPQKVIAMTADLQPRSGKTFEKLGFDGFIQKPFKVNELRDCIRFFINDP